jgi:hypothetical protein
MMMMIRLQSCGSKPAAYNNKYINIRSVLFCDITQCIRKISQKRAGLIYFTTEA